MKEENNKKIETLLISSLTKDPNHSRQDLGDIESLKESIRKDGLIVPINVNRTQDGICFYNDGWRRIEALKAMGKKEVLCLVHDGYVPEDAAHQFYVINKKRKALNPIEEALHINMMNTTFGRSFRHLEIKGYGDATTLSRKAQLVKHPEEVRQQIADGKLSMSHGLALLDLSSDEERINMAKRAVDQEWSATLLEKAIRRYLLEDEKTPEKKVSISDADISGVYFKDARDMSEQEDGSVGLIFTSPPYFLGMEYEQGYSIDDHWDNIEAVMAECARVIMPGGVVALNLNDIHNFKGKKGTDKKAHLELTGHFYQRFLKKHGVTLESQIVWAKAPHAYSTDRSRAYGKETKHAEYKIINRHEFIYLFRKDGERKIPSEKVNLDSILTREDWAKYIPSVWDIPQVWKSEGHPNVFPEELARRVIKMFSFVGEIVLDPFLGSGTTIKVARELAREGVGYEREAELYKEIIAKKLKGTLSGEEGESYESVSEFAKRHMEELEATQPENTETEYAEEGRDYSALAFGTKSTEKELNHA
ncbi:MAG: ParB/RepB/Spo0J family partition protein [Desulfobacter sp.]|nr:MAG: ParB/RepB/Spo0J family partition protein [Desulfobacter sp.]